jgi:hypothetical protein
LGRSTSIFPNKVAILFRLQSDEWGQTNDLMGETLDEHKKPPLERLGVLIQMFIQSECDEATVRVGGIWAAVAEW